MKKYCSSREVAKGRAWKLGLKKNGSDGWRRSYRGYQGGETVCRSQERNTIGGDIDLPWELPCAASWWSLQRLCDSSSKTTSLLPQPPPSPCRCFPTPTARPPFHGPFPVRVGEFLGPLGHFSWTVGLLPSASFASSPSFLIHQQPFNARLRANERTTSLATNHPANRYTVFYENARLKHVQMPLCFYGRFPVLCDPSSCCRSMEQSYGYALSLPWWFIGTRRNKMGRHAPGLIFVDKLRRHILSFANLPPCTREFLKKLLVAASWGRLMKIDEHRNWLDSAEILGDWLTLCLHGSRFELHFSTSDVAPQLLDLRTAIL